MERPTSKAARPEPPKAPDLAEKGRSDSLDRRLFMQLHVLTGCNDPTPIINHLQDRGYPGVLYQHLADPRGIALLTLAEDPAYFLEETRPMLLGGPFAGTALRPELGMIGRSYSLGYEPDLMDTLFHRPTRTVLNADWPWAVWYPLRRSGQFEQLPADEQRSILMEHGTIGRSFGEADLAHDVRLMCHGLDEHDNDFVIGLFGKALHPLSAIVQSMRKTTQTALYLTHLGPFVVGRAIWQGQAPTW